MDSRRKLKGFGKDLDNMLKVVQFRRTTAILTLIAASLGGGLIAAFAVSSHSGAPLYVKASAAAGAAASLPGSFADVVSHAAPAVVSISSTRIIKASEQSQNNPLMADPFFRQFFGNGRQPQLRDRREGSLGSGVIINANGYILTNNHVVDKATVVKVTLLDKREFTAKVVGTDPQTDVAVLKIDSKDLPTLELGDSGHARIGDLCFAIGNPFGVGQTVTMGIVSAKGRSLPREQQSFEDFIQTDAAINPGNSGGALINARGELIGINTAILTGGNSMSGGEGGNIGIGFAIPVNMAEHVMEQLVKNGKVTRGYMGAYLQGINANVARSFGLKDSNGALVDSVEAGKPADKAGMKQGDVITAIDGQPVDGPNALTNHVIDLAPGTTITLDGYRDGRPIQFHVTLGTRPGPDEESAESGGSSKESSSAAVLGVQVENLTSEIRQQLELPAGTSGVVVTGVDESGIAAESGLQRGDVIQQVNRQAVNGRSDFDRLVREAGNKGVLLTVNRQGRTFFTAIESK